MLISYAHSCAASFAFGDDPPFVSQSPPSPPLLLTNYYNRSDLDCRADRIEEEVKEVQQLLQLLDTLLNHSTEAFPLPFYLYTIIP